MATVKKKVPGGQLEGIVAAMADIAANRIGGEKAWDVSEVKQAFADKLKVFGNAKSTLIETHAGKGEKSIAPEHDAWDAFLADYEGLAKKEVAVEFEPLEKSFVLGLDQVTADSIGLLRHIGVIIEKADNTKGKAGK